MPATTNIKDFVKLLMRNVPFSYINKARKQARMAGVDISYEEIEELYFDIDTKSKFSKSLISALASGADITVDDARDIFSASGNGQLTFDNFIKHLIEIKKADIKISSDELIDIFLEGRNVGKIVKTLIKAKKEGVYLELDDVKNIFYSGNDNEIVLTDFIGIKKYLPDISAADIQTAVLEGINLPRLIEIVDFLMKEKLQIPFGILINLLDMNINIVKLIKILSVAKQNSNEELARRKIFKLDVSERLSNIYVFEGKERFKHALSDEILKLKVLINPAELYNDLMKSKGYGFKLNLELIKNYISFDFNADLNKITDAYFLARDNGLHVKFNQLATLAEKNIDITEFVKAQIKSFVNE